MIKKYLTSFMLIIFMLLPLINISAESEEYTFPRKSGNHFTFETSWTNTFDRTQYRNDVVHSSHSFTVHNIDSPVYIQFKKLAIDSNDCYDNHTWTIQLRISDEAREVVRLYIEDDRGRKIEIEQNKKYTISMNVYYNHTYMKTNVYNAIIQMNVVAKGIDEPYYFFEEIDYNFIVEEQVDDGSFYILLLASFLIICVIILNVLIVRRVNHP